MVAADYPDIGWILSREHILDLSQMPVELVAYHQESIRLSQWYPMRISHPDLWFDGRWTEAA